MAKEYIEREAAKSELLSWAACMNHPEYLIKDDALHVIDSIPAADVVKVVRKPVKGYEGYYEVDQFGRVFGLDRIIKVNDNG